MHSMLETKSPKLSLSHHSSLSLSLSLRGPALRSVWRRTSASSSWWRPAPRPWGSGWTSLSQQQTSTAATDLDFTPVPFPVSVWPPPWTEPPFTWLIWLTWLQFQQFTLCGENCNLQPTPYNVCRTQLGSHFDAWTLPHMSGWGGGEEWWAEHNVQESASWRNWHLILDSFLGALMAWDWVADCYMLCVEQEMLRGWRRNKSMGI